MARTKRPPLEQDCYNRSERRLFPAVTRNAEISRGEAIEHSHGSDLTPTNLEVEEAAKEPEAHPEHNCNCGYRSSGHDHAREFSQHDA